MTATLRCHTHYKLCTNHHLSPPVRLSAILPAVVCWHDTTGSLLLLPLLPTDHIARTCAQSRANTHTHTTSCQGVKKSHIRTRARTLFASSSFPLTRARTCASARATRACLLAVVAACTLLAGARPCRPMVHTPSAIGLCLSVNWWSGEHQGVISEKPTPHEGLPPPPHPPRDNKFTTREDNNNNSSYCYYPVDLFLDISIRLLNSHPQCKAAQWVKSPITYSPTTSSPTRRTW